MEQNNKYFIDSEKVNLQAGADQADPADPGGYGPTRRQSFL